MSDPALITACVTCGYDLTGLPEDGACPECATPVERSKAGLRIATADPKWVATLVRGQTMLAWSAVTALTLFFLAIGLPIILTIVASIRAGTRLATVLETIAESMFTVLGVVILAALALAALGAFLVTVQDPRSREREAPTSVRRVARVGMAATPLLFIAAAAVKMAMPALPDALVNAPWALALAVMSVAILRHLRDVVRRVPDEALATRAHDASNVLRTVIPLLVICSLILAGAPGAGTPVQGFLDVVRLFASCAIFIAVIVLLVYLAVLINLLFAIQDSLRACLAEARAEAPTDA